VDTCTGSASFSSDVFDLALPLDPGLFFSFSSCCKIQVRITSDLEEKIQQF